MKSLLDVRGLDVSYGQVVAVRRVSFSVEPGTVLTILGANGAGKTSTVRAIAGSLRYGGEIMLEGKPVPTRSWSCRRAGIAHVPEDRQIFGSLTVTENLKLGGFGRRSRDMSPIYDLLPQLADRRSQLAGTLSGGEQQMLAIGRALVAEPTLLLLDEPTLGLSPSLCDDVFDRLRAIRDGGVTLILVEQQTARALHLADQVLVLRNGRTVASGHPDKFSDPAVLAAAYLSGDVDEQQRDES